ATEELQLRTGELLSKCCPFGTEPNIRKMFFFDVSNDELARVHISAVAAADSSIPINHGAAKQFRAGGQSGTEIPAQLHVPRKFFLSDLSTPRIVSKFHAYILRANHFHYSGMIGIGK